MRFFLDWSRICRTLSVAGSDFSGEVEQESAPEVKIVHEAFRTNSAAIRAAFHGLDVVELRLMFDRRAPVMKNVPHFLCGVFRNCLTLAMEEACQRDPVRCERGWKLFMLMPRMLLHRPPRGGSIPRHKLQERFDAFGRGQWAMLLRQAESIENISIAQRRGHRQQGDDLSKTS